MAKKIATFND